MFRRLLPLALLLGLLVPQCSGVAAVEGTHGRFRGIAVQSASYDAAAGKLTVQVRWNKRELRRVGRDELHIVVYNDSDDPAVLRNRNVTATPNRHTRQYHIKLSKKQRNAAGDGSDLTIVATHKHDDDGGLFERVWYHRYAVSATSRLVSQVCRLLMHDAEASSCDLSGADLAGVNLGGAYFPNANLSGANLSNANLARANFWDANLSGASLAGANLYLAELGSATLFSADLAGANLTNADFLEADLTGANLTNATFCNTTMPEGSVFNVDC